MKEQHTIKDRIKPPLHLYPPSQPIPDLPKIEPQEALVTLMNKEWTARVVKGRRITCLRQIITSLINTDSLPQDFDQVLFDYVVVEEADLTELVIPFKLHFQNTFFLNGLHLNHSKFHFLNVSGYIGYGLSLTETSGQPIVGLANLQADQIHVYGGEGLDCFDVSTSTIGSLTLASTTIKRHISLHDHVDILDGLWIEDVSVEHGVNLWRCTVETFFRIHKVCCSKNIELEVCDLRAPLRTLNSSCSKLSLNESKCSGRLDFRNLYFHEIDLSNTIITGQVLLNLQQIQRKENKGSPPEKPFRRWDIPPCLSPQRGNTLGEPVTIAEQLIVLRENFRRIPTAGPQEQYCSYQLMDASWTISHPSVLSNIARWIAKWGFGYLLLPWRIVLTMAVLIALFTCLYIVLPIFCVGHLVFSDGRFVFQDGIVFSIARSLYFSVVTFSTLGYGDIYPVGYLKLVAAVEAFIGLIVAAIFVVSLTRKIFRW